MAPFAFAKQHLALGVGQDDADPDAGIESGHENAPSIRQ
jgi:hypothetical protein